MAQVTLNLPSISNWRTTLFGILTAVGAAVFQAYMHGGLTWQGGVACALWALFCYLVPDAATGKNYQAQIEQLLNQVSGLRAQIPPPNVQARTAAPATDPPGQAIPNAS